MTALCKKCGELYYTGFGTSQVKEYKQKKYMGFGQMLERKQSMCPSCKRKKR
jgi:hypothetical protein